MEVDVIIIGTGFGASVAVTKLLEKKPNATIHMLSEVCGGSLRSVRYRIIRFRYD